LELASRLASIETCAKFSALTDQEVALVEAM